MLHIEGGCFSLGRYAETREQWGRLSGPLLGDHNNAQEKVFSMHYHSITQYHDIYNTNTTINKRKIFFWKETIVIPVEFPFSICYMTPKDIVWMLFFSILQKSIICYIFSLLLAVFSGQGFWKRWYLFQRFSRRSRSFVILNLAAGIQFEHNFYQIFVLFYRLFLSNSFYFPYYG